MSSPQTGSATIARRIPFSSVLSVIALAMSAFTLYQNHFYEKQDLRLNIGNLHGEGLQAYMVFRLAITNPGTHDVVLMNVRLFNRRMEPTVTGVPGDPKHVFCDLTAALEPPPALPILVKSREMLVLPLRLRSPLPATSFHQSKLPPAVCESLQPRGDAANYLYGLYVSAIDWTGKEYNTFTALARVFGAGEYMRREEPSSRQVSLLRPQDTRGISTVNYQPQLPAVTKPSNLVN